MPPLPLYPNVPAGQNDINWGAMGSYDVPSGGGGGSNDAYLAVDEARKRAQLESDREYKLRAKQIKNQAAEIAIKKGQAAAEKWEKQQMVQLAKDKLAEEQRQFNATFGENQRQFNVTSSGYLDNGSPTLAREQFQEGSLQNWTDKALALSRLPQDWVTLSRLQRGVADNIGSIPGLNWASGGQVGNTTFAGQPQSNSLANVLGNMGINVGQGGGGGGGNWASQAAETANRIATAPLNLRPDQQQIYRTAREFGMNPQGAAPGWYESLDPSLRDEIQGAMEDQGLSWADTMSRYKRSRWGGGGGALAA